GVPAGRNVPLVVQIGRWRRQVTIPEVASCADTALPAELTRLPRNQAEGNLPAVAIATGEWDPFDCTLRKIGIDEAEFTLPGGPGRVNVWMYGGHHLGPGTPYGDQLVGDPSLLARYDIVVLPCDSTDAKDPRLQRNLVNYANRGGRIFLTDGSASWLRGAFDNTVVWKLPTPRLWRLVDFVGQVDVMSALGKSFSQWLNLVGADGSMAGQIRIHDALPGGNVVESVVPPTEALIYTAASAGGAESIQNFTFDTPVGAPTGQQCGRVVFSQFHVASDSFDQDPLAGGPPALSELSAPTFPAECNAGPMTPQEKALEFMLFNATSCLESSVSETIVP
ncbi:MAG TPA: hypothetical protein VMU50_02750, partial [Polyangia bacterium]|nr:hypothetical protein [Polyangia bacterium]